MLWDVRARYLLQPCVISVCRPLHLQQQAAQAAPRQLIARLNETQPPGRQLILREKMHGQKDFVPRHQAVILCKHMYQRSHKASEVSLDTEDFVLRRTSLALMIFSMPTNPSVSHTVFYLSTERLTLDRNPHLASLVLAGRLMSAAVMSAAALSEEERKIHTDTPSPLVSSPTF